MLNLFELPFSWAVEIQSQNETFRDVKRFLSCPGLPWTKSFTVEGRQTFGWGMDLHGRPIG